MLTIKNIDKLVGHHIHLVGAVRRITSVHEERNMKGENVYVFTFPERLDGKRFNEKREVRLLRTNDGRGYELFVMGLHGITVQRLHLSDITNNRIFVTKIAEVLETAKHWWENVAHKNT